MLRKISVLFFAFILLFTLVGYQSTFAEEIVVSKENPSQATSTEIEFDPNDVEPVDEDAIYQDATTNPSITIDTSGGLNSGLITPFATYHGNGGVSKLDYLHGGNAIYWHVDPDTLAPYGFVGKLVIYRNGNWWKSYKLTGSAIAGFPVSDTIELPKMSKGEYKFKLSGVATAVSTKIKIFTVSRNAELYVYK
ncbi:hypothetical protein CHH83_05810 [Bacillus sp. 7586-K]|nr:hypothetical protein CHH83_05810 [Bacillus sp. 7586-K]